MRKTECSFLYFGTQNIYRVLGFLFFYEIRICNLLVRIAAGITEDNLIKCMFGLGQKRVLYSVTAVTCHSFAEYGRLMCFIGPGRLLVAMSFKLLSIEFDLKYA